MLLIKQVSENLARNASTQGLIIFISPHRCTDQKKWGKGTSLQEIPYEASYVSVRERNGDYMTNKVFKTLSKKTVMLTVMIF